MRWSHAILPAVLLGLTAVVSAQKAITVNGVPTIGASAMSLAVINDDGRSTPPPPLPPSEVIKITPADVETHLLTFDRDYDGKIARDELTERMQPLVERGDRDGDGALDSSEILLLTTAQPAPVAVRGFPSPGGYGFSDESGLSSRLHFEGALDDLRLNAATKEPAVARVRTFVEAHETSAVTTLLKEMEGLLTTTQLAEFKRGMESQSRIMAFKKEAQNTAQVVFLGFDPGRFMQRFALPPATNQQALAAIARFKSEFHLGEADRLALLDQLKDILSDEDRDNFRAAIERRPLMKATGFDVQVGSIVGGVVGGIAGGIVGAPSGNVVGAQRVSSK